MIRTLRAIVFLLIMAVCFGAPAFSAEVHEAAKSGDVVKLKAMLDKDSSLLYAKDEQGKTPLHWAVGRGQLDVMKFLLDECHVKIDVRNDNEGTPLHVAASQAQPEAARILIAHGAAVDARTMNGSTPLHFAAFKGGKPGHLLAARVLIEHGADVNARTDNGATPLSMALSRGNSEIVKLLRDHGARAVKDGQNKRRGQRTGQGRALE